MTKEDIDKLFSLMAELFIPPKDMNLENRKRAWYLALKDIAYPLARAAVLAESRRGKHFPALGEIAQHLPQPPAAATPPHDDGLNDPVDTWALAWWEKHLKTLREHGLPTAMEARKQGMQTEDYIALLNDHGL